MLAFRPIRRWCTLLLAAAFLLLFPRILFAQDNEPSLGDLARSLRKKPAVTEIVIDNDNLNKVMDDADSRRAAGWSSVFSLAVPARNVQISGPDVMCSLSYTGNSSSQASDPLLLEDLPREELSKLEGPASIDGDTLQVSTHNGTTWELRELVVGLTIMRDRDDVSLPAGQLHLVPALAGTSQSQDSSQKPPDTTILLHLKGTAAPSATVTFRTALNFALFPDQQWRWSILKAKGIPPQSAASPAGEQIPSQQPPAANSDPAAQLNPVLTTPATATPVTATPVTATPVTATPEKMSPPQK